MLVEEAAEELFALSTEAVVEAVVPLVAVWHSGVDGAAFGAPRKEPIKVSC
jgi:hypothetical protein